MKIDSSISITKIQAVKSDSLGESNETLAQEKSKEISNEISSQKLNEKLNEKLSENDKVNGQLNKENEDLLAKAVEQANKVLIGYHRKIEREVHEKTKVLMYKIKDTETDEVIKEFPPEKIQDMMAKMWELAGLFVDEKA